MRIGIVILCKTIGGPKVYGYNLVKALSSINKENDYKVLTDDVQEFRGIPNISPILIKLRSLYALPWWDYIGLSNTTKRLNLQVFHNTKGVLPYSMPCKSVVTIHDMAPFLFPHTFPRSHRIYLQYSMARAAGKSDFIITVSENSKQDILRIFNLKEEKVKVIYNGISENFKPINDESLLYSIRQKYGFPDKIILYIGTLQPRKNVDTLIRSYYRLRKEKKIEHQLVIAGRKGWLVKELIKLVDELRLSKDVVFTGYIPDKDLPSLYNLADIFVYPSSYEGFGLSVLEAMACGTPVITTNISSLPEVVSDAGMLLNSINEDELADAMWTLISNDSLRQDYSQKGIIQAKKFSWKRAAEETLQLYTSL